MPTGKRSNRSCDRDALTVQVVRCETRGPYSTEFCGSWVREHSGAKCPRNIHRTRSATARFQQWVREGKLERIFRVHLEFWRYDFCLGSVRQCWINEIDGLCQAQPRPGTSAVRLGTVNNFLATRCHSLIHP